MCSSSACKHVIILHATHALLNYFTANIFYRTFVELNCTAISSEKNLELKLSVSACFGIMRLANEQIKHQVIKEYLESDIYIHITLTSAPAAGDLSVSRLTRSTPGEVSTCILCIYTSALRSSVQKRCCCPSMEPNRRPVACSPLLYGLLHIV